MFRLLVCCFLIVTCGCVPAPYSYYEPATYGGELSSAVPGAFAAPKDKIEFSYSGVKIQLQGGRNGVYLVVSIPEGMSASFVSEELEWFEGSSGNRMKARFNLAYFDSQTGKVMSSRPTDVMARSDKDGAFLVGPKSGIYENYVKFDETEKGRYTVKLPAIRIDGKTYEIQPVEFSRKEGFGVFPVNK